MQVFKVFGCVTFYFLEHVLCLWAENNDLWIFKHLHAFSPSNYEKVVSVMPSLSMYVKIGKKDKAIPVSGRGGPQGCETSRLPYFVDSRLTDGGEVSLTRRPPFTPRIIPGTHFR
jgi:hypothetical protein